MAVVDAIRGHANGSGNASYNKIKLDLEGNVWYNVYRIGDWATLRKDCKWVR